MSGSLHLKPLLRLW